MLKSRAGYMLGAAALLLALSPGARNAVRGLAVKGIGVALMLSDKVKEIADKKSAHPSEGSD